MPREKTVQPAPLESLVIDGTTIEVRDETCQSIGRGLHMKYKFIKWRDQVAQWVIPQYLDKNGSKNINSKDDFMISASKFSETLSKKRPDLYPQSGDDSSARKRLYKYLKDEILILSLAIAEVKKKGTSRARR